MQYYNLDSVRVPLIHQKNKKEDDILEIHEDFIKEIFRVLLIGGEEEKKGNIKKKKKKQKKKLTLKRNYVSILT